jgi:predicted NACHT family NTPase
MICGKLLAESLTGLMGTEATACAKLMVEQLRDRNFILCFLGGYNEDYFAFVHRTFLEYFCAWEFVWQFEREQNNAGIRWFDSSFSVNTGEMSLGMKCCV